jgi:hypothetical protein
MKRSFKRPALVALLCLSLSASLPLPTWQTSGLAARPQQPSEPDLQRIRVLNSRVLSPSVVATRFARLREVPQIKAVDAFLTRRGFRPQTVRARDYFGVEETFRHPDGRTGQLTMVVQNYAKPNSKDLAAVGRVTVISGSESKTYAFSLEAPGGDFEKAVEHFVNPNLEVVRANSFWSCFKNRVRSRCVSACITAIPSCLTTNGESWVSYLGCLAATCGGCAARAFACCGCDCSVWCRWGAGCCEI